ncbi:hypothetical protein [Candidatus Karelsulcia muelleri]
MFLKNIFAIISIYITLVRIFQVQEYNLHLLKLLKQLISFPKLLKSSILFKRKTSFLINP